MTDEVRCGSHDRRYPRVVVETTARSVEETIRRLERAITERELTVFAHFDHSAAAQSVGLELASTHVLVFGSPKSGTLLMQVAPLVALELPLKVLVWQAADGSTRVAYEDPAGLAARFGVPAELAANISGIAALVNAAL